MAKRKRDSFMTSTVLPLFIVGSLAGTAYLLIQTFKEENLKGFEFTLSDVDTYCRLVTTNRRDGDFVCSDERLRPVERYCEGFFEGATETIVALYCRQAGLVPIEKRCEIEMIGVKEGVVNCD